MWTKVSITYSINIDKLSESSIYVQQKDATVELKSYMQPYSPKTEAKITTAILFLYLAL